jgi:ABC-type branched-subunit amino acid transport system substrate-binding protein
LLLSACGLRVDDTTRQALLEQSVRGPGTSLTSTTGEDGTVQPGQGPSAVAATSGPQQVSQGSAGGPVVPGAAGPTVAASPPAGGNGGATDIGVTATSITVGTIADQSGPQPGLFDGAVAGVRAYFAYVNSTGGVYGRTLRTKVVDSQLECNATTNAYSSLIPETFALVGGFQLYDNCGAAVLRQHPEVPDVSFALNPEHSEAPSTFQVQPSVPGGRPGPPLAFAKAFPQVKGAVGGMYPDVAGARAQWAQYRATLEASGFTVLYEARVSATEVDYTRYVIGMRQAGVQMAVMLNSAVNNAKFVNAAIQQAWNPPVIQAQGTIYEQAFVDALDSVPSNLYAELGFALYHNAEERRIPGVALFQDWMKRTAPDQALDQFAVYGWSLAGLYVQALRDAGPKAKRATLIAALKKIHSFDAQGLVISGDPGARKPFACYILTHLEKGGAWKRWNTPASSPRCDAPYFFMKD